MKFLFEIILITIIIFFCWNILKRLFFSYFYRFPKQEKQDNKGKSKKKGLNWDAETIDYEEVKDPEKEKK